MRGALCKAASMWPVRFIDNYYKFGCAGGAGHLVSIEISFEITRIDKVRTT